MLRLSYAVYKVNGDQKEQVSSFEFEYQAKADAGSRRLTDEERNAGVRYKVEELPDSQKTPSCQYSKQNNHSTKH